jgi:creatinine amidohydrolase
MRTHQVELLRPSEIIQAVKEASVAYLPVGPLEWHGPHYIVGTDPLNAQNIAYEAAEITGGLIFPTLFFGTERERSTSDLRAIGFQGGSGLLVWIFLLTPFPALMHQRRLGQ